MQYVRFILPQELEPQLHVVSSHHCLNGKQYTSITHENLTDFFDLKISFKSSDVVNYKCYLP